MDKVEIKYYGHSCFRLEYRGQRIVIDPYAPDMVRGLKPLCAEAEFLYCSHGHDDHGYTAAVQLTTGAEPNFGVKVLDTDHDDAGGARRGPNKVHIFDFDGIRVAHMGDIGRMITDAEAAELRGVDCLMIPVGGFFTIGAETAKAIIEKVNPRVTVPMHYRTDCVGFAEIEHVDNVRAALGESRTIGCSFELSAETGRQILFMTPDNAGVDEWAVSRRTRGCNCCQSVLCSLQEYTGLDYDTAVSLGYGFAAGMFCGNVCGAVTGASMAIGKAALPADRLQELKPRSHDIFMQFQETFAGRFDGTVLCGDITGRYAKTRCNECVAYAAAEAEKLIKKLKEEID